MIGTVLGSYRLLAEIGSGGMGTVYRAEALESGAHGAAGTPVAIKVVHAHLAANAEARSRFEHEARVGSSVEHPNLVRTHGSGAALVEGAETLFLVMEYVEGQSLDALIADLGAVPEGLLRRVGRDVALGLEALHGAGLVHRDVRPDNVLITPDERVKLTDLGVADAIAGRAGISTAQEFSGSFRYAAPEQLGLFDAAVDGRADLFALGVSLFEAATGHHPWGAEARGHTMPIHPPSAADYEPPVSPQLDALLRRLMTLDPERRPASAADVARVLDDPDPASWWRRRESSAGEIPPERVTRIRVARKTPIHGRERALGQLCEAFELALGGFGGAALIRGEAGIGKTRLLAEFVDAARQRTPDVVILHGAYPPGGGAPAVAAIAEAFVGRLSRTHLDRIVARLLPDVPVLRAGFAAVLQGDAHAAGDDAWTVERFGRATNLMLRALARERPTVLLVEGLHCAPEAGRELFSTVASAGSAGLLVVGTGRRPVDGPWLKALRRARSLVTIDLERLTEPEIRSLVEDALGSPELARTLRKDVLAKSDGNPFFALEILDGLRRSGAIVEQPHGGFVQAQDVLELNVGASVAELIRARLEELPGEDREFLELAACCGFSFDPADVAAAAGVGEIETLRRLARIERDQRVVAANGRRYEFDHHQIHLALYGELFAPLKEAYHDSLAKVIVSRAEKARRPLSGAESVAVAEHLLNGGHGTEALGHLEPALAHLEATHSRERLLGLTERVLALPVELDAARTMEVLWSQGQALGALGKSVEARTVFGRARDLADAAGDSSAQARASDLLGEELFTAGEVEAALEVTVEGISRARAGGDDRLVAILVTRAGSIHEERGAFDEARRHYEIALASARRLGDLALEALATGHVGQVLRAAGNLEEAREHISLQVELSEQLGDGRALCNALTQLGVVYDLLERTDEARDAYERARAAAQSVDELRAEAFPVGNLGTLAHLLGHSEEALRHHERALEIGNELQLPRIQAIATACAGSAYLFLGAPQCGEEYLRKGLEMSRSIGSRWMESEIQGYLADALRTAGRFDEARAAFEEAIAISREVGLRMQLEAQLRNLADLLTTLGEQDAARAAASESLALAIELGAPGPLAAATAAAALSDGRNRDRARTLLEELEPGLRPLDRLPVLLSLWELTGEERHLRAAYDLVQHFVRHAPAEFRESLVDRNPAHRRVVEALAALEAGGPSAD